MKFESEFGIGEIVTIDQVDGEKPFNINYERRLKTAGDFGKIVEVRFCGDGVPTYAVEQVCPNGSIMVRYISSHRLGGDPDFDHELGRYPIDEGES